MKHFPYFFFCIYSVGVFFFFILIFCIFFLLYNFYCQGVAVTSMASPYKLFRTQKKKFMQNAFKTSPRFMCGIYTMLNEWFCMRYERMSDVDILVGTNISEWMTRRLFFHIDSINGFIFCIYAHLYKIFLLVLPFIFLVLFTRLEMCRWWWCSDCLKKTENPDTHQMAQLIDPDIPWPHQFPVKHLMLGSKNVGNKKIDPEPKKLSEKKIERKWEICWM